MGHNVVCNKGKMLRLQLVCLAIVSAASAETPATAKPNTRIFGLGNIVDGALGAIGGALQPGGYQAGGFQQGGGFQGGFQQPGGFQQGAGSGFQGGIQQGGGFGIQGGIQQPGGFGQPYNPGFPGGAGINTRFPQQIIPQAAAPASCRRWCRTPQGQAYCCESANEQITAAITKQGQCPPVRPSCPPTRFGQPPRQCSSDGACGGYDKCCFDTCLQHHTCKPPIGAGRK